MILATSSIGDDKSITASVTGPQTVIVCLSGRNVFVLHGKLVGLIMGLVLSVNNSQDNKLFTDHLNSVRFIDDSKTSINQESCLRNMNGCSYYRWIMDLAHRIRILPKPGITQFLMQSAKGLKKTGPCLKRLFWNIG